MLAKLTVLDRLILPTLIPSKGKFVDLMIREELAVACKFTSDEIEKHGLEQVPDPADPTKVQTVWKKDASFEREFTDVQAHAVKKALMELEEKSELSPEHMGLYRAFVI